MIKFELKQQVNPNMAPYQLVITGQEGETYTLALEESELRDLRETLSPGVLPALAHLVSLKFDIMLVEDYKAQKPGAWAAAKLAIDELPHAKRCTCDHNAEISPMHRPYCDLEN